MKIYDGPLWCGMHVELRGGLIGKICRIKLAAYLKFDKVTCFEIDTAPGREFAREHIQPFGTAELKQHGTSVSIFDLYEPAERVPGFFQEPRPPP